MNDVWLQIAARIVAARIVSRHLDDDGSFDLAPFRGELRDRVEDELSGIVLELTDEARRLEEEYSKACIKAWDESHPEHQNEPLLTAFKPSELDPGRTTENA